VLGTLLTNNYSHCVFKFCQFSLSDSCFFKCVYHKIKSVLFKAVIGVGSFASRFGSLILELMYKLLFYLSINSLTLTVQTVAPSKSPVKVKVKFTL
jgi:hypothetical protein